MIGLAALSIAVTIAASPAPVARPQISAFRCEIGEGRTHLLVPRAREEHEDEDLRCHAFLIGLRPESTAELVGELRIQGPGARFRVVATGTFLRDGRFARLDALTVPHATWTSAVVWQTAARPRLEVSVHVFTRPPGARKWRPLLTRSLVLDHRRR